MSNDIKRPVRKYQRKDPLENNRELIKFAKESSRKAIGDLLDSGIDVVYIKDGHMVKESPSRKVTIVGRTSKITEQFSLKDYLCQG